MTSIPPSRIGDQQRYDPDVRKAAEKYVQDYHKHAVKYLIDNCDPVQLLKDACTFEHHNYFQVMAQESEFDDDTVSRSSRRRTYSSNSRSAITSASSVNISSSESGDSSPDILWVVTEASPKRPITVRATTLPQSDNLIQVDVARTRLMLEPRRLPCGTEVRYIGGPMHSLGTVSLEWAGRCKDLGSRKTQRGTFHVVEEIPDKDVVLGDLGSADSPTSHKDTFSFNHDPRPGVYGEFPGRERPPPLNTHIVFQEAPRTHSNTANSTALTAKQTVIDRPSQGHTDRRKTAASENSKIPRMSSGSSVGSISTNQSRVPIRQRQNEGPLHRPPPSDPGLTSGFSVTVIYGKSIMSFKLELNAPGATFYESLKRTIRQRTRRDLDRDLDLVCFTPSKDSFSNCCYVSLAEDQVADDWENAVEWINDIKSEGQRKIFAIIGPEDDTPPG